MVRMKKKKLIMLIVAVIAATLIVAGGGIYIYSSVADVTLVNKTAYKNMERISEKYAKLDKLQTLIEENSLWKVNEEKEMDALYTNAVENLGDKYSEYMNAETYAKWKDLMDGQFSGLGIQFTQNKEGKYEVTGIVENSPAASAGIEKGDILISCDGKTYDDDSEMANAMRGREGTKVTLVYTHNGKEKSTTMVRSVIKEKTVYSTILDNKIGYIGIGSFSKDTAEEFKTELSDLESKNVKSMVIDIRNNGGGYTDEGVKIADMLLPEGTVTYMEDRDGKKTYYNSDENCTKIKYVLLINNKTASTSEILASAIKDNKGGKLVGTTTYGKGIVQGSYSLGDGSVVKLTIMQYFSPNGNKIHKLGVKPDYEVNLTDKDTKDVQLEKAISLLE